MKLLKKFFLICICILLILTAVAAAFYLITTKNSNLDRSKLTASQNNVIILDNEGNELAQISTVKARKSITLSQTPAHLKNAFVSIEDKNFYNHSGLDYLRIGKAFYNNLKSRSYKEGASTISQQLIKNTHLSNEKTISRKLKEIKLTKQLEKKYTKDEIMEMYLNTIYFGHNRFGIENAAEFYFNKEAKNLNVAESALLAAIIKAPNTYSPFNNPEKSLKRRNLVIDKLQEYGYIDKNTAEKAKQVTLPVQKNISNNAQIYIQSVYKELENVLTLSPYSIIDGCKIYTYMNKYEQEYVENLKTTADRSGKSIIILDNDTGGVSAFFSTEGNVKRQPGSIIKPLAVYAPAIEENIIVPCTPVLDEKTNFNGYSPSNFKNEYHGYVSARYSLAQSLNIPAVKILNEVGIEKSEKYLNNMGLTLTEQDKNLSLALGGMSLGYSLDQLVGAYSVFANNGYYVQPRFIKKIEDKYGNVLFKDDATIKRKIFSPETTAMINDMLLETAKNGTAKKLANLTFGVCAKTGTSGTEKGNTDAYTITYTPEKTVAVWMGNYDNKVTDIYGGGLPCHYAYLINKEIHKNKSISKFVLPSSIVSLKLDKYEYETNHKIILADDFTPSQYSLCDIFKASNIPKEKSNKFSTPTITAPTIYYKNNTVFIDLCDTEYYNYRINRQNNNKTIVIYDGKYIATFKDDTTLKNQKYVYSITPYVKNSNEKIVFGKTITLPAVYTKFNNYEKLLDEISYD